MQYTLRCHRCTGAQIVCDELPTDPRCPKCGSVPASYEFSGEESCWRHRTPMTARYPVSPHVLTTTYVRVPPDEKDGFPNAQWYPGGTPENHFVMAPYCNECQRLYEAWLDGWRRTHLA